VAQVRHVGAISVITLRGEIDLSTAAQFDAAIRTAEHARPLCFIIDLRPTEFFDSAGVAILCDLVSRVAGTGRAVHVTGARPLVRHVLEITGLGPLLDDASMPDLASTLPLLSV